MNVFSPTLLGIGFLLLVKSVWVLLYPKEVTQLMHSYANHPKKLKMTALLALLLSVAVLLFSLLTRDI
ncbi:MAG TPA: hypothetical protein VJK07_03420 [Candidatus Nanoarchaeia archaeon]|nr:hypothetical protein [Candidatus Nanoarchaeia archaeon]